MNERKSKAPPDVGSVQEVEGMTNQEFNQVLQLIISLIEKTITNEEERRELIAELQKVINTKG